MRLRATFAGLTILTVACSGLSGCSSEPSGTNIEVKKPMTEAELKAEQDKIKAGMKTGGGTYQGAPGIPQSKTK
jgi:hypothetical protein